LAVRIVRQANQIALIGAPTSAAAHGPGVERAPAALRAAGLIERLRAVGFEVTNLGDSTPELYQPDEESPRARNLPRVLAALHVLRGRVEQAVKSGALPVILGGDCTIALATLAGLRRYYRHVSLLYFDRDADLNVPATSPSGCLHGMVVSHATGHGAPELVRFWNEPPLVREPDVALFGLDRLDPPERQALERSPMLRYTAAQIQQRGAADAAATALERIHGTLREFVLHLDVDVISSEDFQACDFPAAGGLRAHEVRQALETFLRAPRLAALEITEYNPDRDLDSSGARLLVDLLASAAAARREALAAPQAAAVAAGSTDSDQARAGAAEPGGAPQVAPELVESSNVAPAAEVASASPQQPPTAEAGGAGTLPEGPAEQASEE